ncbi:hypothetical protein T440DRAFT_101636 [Plenodomus tracheiphilus IPT5]|uniref:Uncharacterized protein n=1 Tax=Plenodomus tracheiphilus IPT5 TaxID=1408161 RepID=A0A6A7BLB5_9PLEO|nr:hypothetical protein T440DRAFT_101636 [Plenodomus tracheiphilus IPT5]
MSNIYNLPELFVPDTYHELEAVNPYHHVESQHFSTGTIEEKNIPVSYDVTEQTDQSLRNAMYQFPVSMAAVTRYQSYDIGHTYQNSPELTSDNRTNESSPITPETPRPEHGRGEPPRVDYDIRRSPVSPFGVQKPHSNLYGEENCADPPMQHSGHLPIYTPYPSFTSSSSMDFTSSYRGPSPDAITGSYQHTHTGHMPRYSVIGTWERQDDSRWVRQNVHESVHQAQDSRQSDPTHTSFQSPYETHMARPPSDMDTLNDPLTETMVCPCGSTFTGQ